MFIYGKVVKGVRIGLHTLGEDSNIYIVTVDGKEVKETYKVKRFKEALYKIKRLEVKYI